jgi:hypothetical protein
MKLRHRKSGDLDQRQNDKSDKIEVGFKLVLNTFPPTQYTNVFIYSICKIHFCGKHSRIFESFLADKASRVIYFLCWMV